MDAIKQKLEELQQRRHAIYAWLCTTEQYQELLQLDAAIGVLQEVEQSTQNVPQNKAQDRVLGDTVGQEIEEFEAVRSGV